MNIYSLTYNKLYINKHKSFIYWLFNFEESIIKIFFLRITVIIIIIINKINEYYLVYEKFILKKKIINLKKKYKK